MVKLFDTAHLDENLMRTLSSNEASWIYNGLDACVTGEIYQSLRAQLDEEDPRVQATHDFTTRKLAPFVEMALRGTLVDGQALAATVDDLWKTRRELDAKFQRIMREVVGGEVNWNSPLQVKQLLYATFGLKPIKGRNAKGFYVETVGEEALEYLKIYLHVRPIVSMILTLRGIAKSIGFLKTKLDEDGRIRTSYNLAGTNTGRLSSAQSEFGSGTNLQNVDRSLRNPFVADPGMIMVNIDLEQADARNVGAVLHNLFYHYEAKDIAKLLGKAEWNGPIGPAFSSSYLDACESGDLHTTVCNMAWPNLAWPEDPAGWKAYCDGLIMFGQDSYRDISKKLGHGCLTADHEVLTRTGWVSITKKPAEIMQWAEKDAQFVTVSNWVDKPYSGNLQSFAGNSISALMTHDHRVPYKADSRSVGIKERPASSGPQKMMPLGGNWIGGNEVVPAKLIAAFMADGHQEKNWMAFHFHKPRKFSRLIKLCKEYDYEYRRHGNKIRVRGSLPKYPGAYQFNWTAACLQDYIHELKYWDGHQSETAVTISSTRLQDLKWYQTFGRLCGVGGQISGPFLSGFRSSVYRLQQNKRQWASGPSVRHTIVPVTNQQVYCPTVPSGWFFVRRQGKIYVTGNTNYYGQPRTMAKHTRTPTPIIEGFQRNYFGAFPAIPAWHAWTINEVRDQGVLYNLFGRRRHFFGRGTDARTHRQAIAYSPQSTTGEQIDRGLYNVWAQFDTADVQFLNQVHDSILFQVPMNGHAELLTRILDVMQVTLQLEGGRNFTAPLEAKTGWNWGDFDAKKNPFGLAKWRGTETRERPSPRRRLKDYL